MFLKVCKKIQSNSPFFEKSIEKSLSNSDVDWKKFAEQWVSILVNTQNKIDGSDNSDQSVTKLAKDYIDYTKMIRIEEMHYLKSKDYRYKDFNEVYERVYGNDARMQCYVTGLGMTQIFWQNHYRIVNFYINEFLPLTKGSTNFAEIGVGHGLFHYLMHKNTNFSVTSKILDVSDYAVKWTKTLLMLHGVKEDQIKITLGDVQKRIDIEDNSLDVLLLGEIIEHLKSGEDVMKKLSRKVNANGHCFFTTAANAPAEDHILLFKNVKEIRDFVSDCNWDIVKENIDTTNDVPLKTAEENLTNINYSAILKRKT